MRWYKIAEGPTKKYKFLLMDMTYYPVFLEVKKRIKKLESLVAYVDFKNNLATEFMAEEERKVKADFGYQFFLDTNKFKKYKSEIQNIIGKVSNYKKLVDKINFNDITINSIIKLFKGGMPLYHKAIGLFLILQPEYTYKIEILTKDEFNKVVPKEKVSDIFNTLTISPMQSCLEEERHDWLKNIAIKTVGKFSDFKKEKKDLLILKKIDKHIDQYKYYSASVEFDLWDREHYFKLLKDDFKKGKISLKKELSDIQDKKQNITKKKQKIIKEYKIPQKLVRKTNSIAELGVLRMNLRVLGWQFFNYLFPKLINISAEKQKAPQEIIANLSYIDFLKFLKDGLKIKESKEKNKNILITITHNTGYKVFRGKLADTKFKNDVKEKIGKTNKLKGVVANKKGIVRGKAFLFKWEAQDFKERIYGFPRGAILVAGQTRPLLMPAIRKAKAIITDEGGLLCHAAIVSRELNIPCIIGTKNGTKLINDNDIVEANTETGVIKILKRAK